jgi:hypothetical protein
MDLEEQGSVEPIVKQECEECGAALTVAETKAALESGGRYLCSVHAAEEVTADEGPESEQAP